MPTIRNAEATDADRICTIYNHYVENAVATFEEEPVSPEEMRQRISTAQERLFWLVYQDDSGEILGYAYASAWKTRAAYRHAVETSVYVDHARRGQRIGHALYSALLHRLRHADVHSVIGGVGGENPASVALHGAFGFQQVARLREVGRKFDQWIDVTYFQLLIAKDSRGA